MYLRSMDFSGKVPDSVNGLDPGRVGRQAAEPGECTIK
jgi:hypothetical protein